jgi:hypothetical protein
MSPNCNIHPGQVQMHISSDAVQVMLAQLTGYMECLEK